MNKTLRYIFALALIMSLGACTAVVRTKIQTYTNEEHSLSKGRVRILPKSDKEGSSLEFKYYRDKLAEKLSAMGMTPVGKDQTSDYTARLGYTVSRQEKDKPHSRILVGSHLAYHTRYPHTSLLISDGNTPEFEYVRDIDLSIEQNTAKGSKDPVHIVEVKASSVGKCGHLSVVYDEMLDAIFGDLMRPNGSLVKVSVQGEARCP